MRILVVEDDTVLAAALTRALNQSAYAVDLAPDGEAANLALATTTYDLVVLDIALPKVDGLAVLRRLRDRRSITPVLILTARDTLEDRVNGLDLGADDYLTKPFGSAEFAARVRAQLRRARPVEGTPEGKLRLGPLELDLDERAATRDGASVHLTPIEWGLLRALARSAGRTLTHRALFDAVWGREFGDAAQYLRVHVTNLRRKVEADSSRPVYIVTEPGVGYRLELTR